MASDIDNIFNTISGKKTKLTWHCFMDLHPFIMKSHLIFRKGIICRNKHVTWLFVNKYLVLKLYKIKRENGYWIVANKGI